MDEDDHFDQLAATSKSIPIETVLDCPTKYHSDIFESYPASLLHFAAFCCVLFITLGVPGNAITVLALGRSKRVHSATAAFIINLSVADLMLCAVNLPLAISNFLNRGWIHGEFLCELFPLLRYGNVGVSLLSVMAITVNRFTMIIYPNLYPKIFKPSNIAVMIATLWLISFGPLLPTWAGWWGRFGFDNQVGTCSILSVDGRSPKSFLFALGFVLPCIIVVICYLRIFFVVKKSAMKTKSNTQVTAEKNVRRPGGLRAPPTDPLGHGRIRAAKTSRNKNSRDIKLLKMILVIFGAFFICYLPLTIVKVLGKEVEMPVLNIFSYIAIYLTSCTNPIIYVVMSREYRRAYIELFTCATGKVDVRQQENRQNSNEGSGCSKPLQSI
ncbi:hypothetical protein CHUAL_006540 [Chamberlinius hualienensis]